MLALFHLSVTCYRSGHIPPPAESRGGWPLSSSTRHSPPAESLGNQVGRLTFIFLSSWGLEAHTTLRNGCRCHRHCDFWCVVWFHGTCGIPTSRRVSRDYICLNSGVILSTLLHLPYPDRVVVWHSVQSVFTRLFTTLIACLSVPQDMCIVCCDCQPITDGWTVFYPLWECESDYRGALSRRLHDLTYGPPWTTTSVHIHLFDCP